LWGLLTDPVDKGGDLLSKENEEEEEEELSVNPRD
jgi:hypothetical protein